MAPRGTGPQFQQDDGMDALDGPNQGDVSSDTPGSKGMAGDGRVPKKKKKTRPYSGLSYSDGGTAADTGGKVLYACVLYEGGGGVSQLVESCKIRMLCLQDVS